MNSLAWKKPGEGGSHGNDHFRRAKRIGLRIPNLCVGAISARASEDEEQFRWGAEADGSGCEAHRGSVDVGKNVLPCDSVAPGKD